MECPGDLENKLSESDSDRKPEPEVAYHRVDGDLEWGGEIPEHNDNDEDFYAVRHVRRRLEVKAADGESVDGMVTLNMDLALSSPVARRMYNGVASKGKKRNN